MLALHRFGMNGLLILALIVLVVIMSAGGLSACAGGPIACTRTHCVSAGLSRSVQRLMHRLKSVCRTVVDLLLVSLGLRTGAIAAPTPWLAFGPALQRALPLRI